MGVTAVQLTAGDMVNGAHADPTCTSMVGSVRALTSVWMGITRSIGGTFEPKYFLHNVDGGLFVSRGSSDSGPVYVQYAFPAGCTLARETTTSAVYRDTGVAETNLAPFSIVRD